MAIVKCENGHFYNNEESANCPYCSGTSALGNTIPLDGGNVAPLDNNIGATIPLEAVQQTAGAINPTMPINPDGGVTVIIDNDSNSEIKPVRGWLVVIEGKKRGMDFKIHNGMNTIGRDKTNDIHFDFDPTVTGKNACSIAYDDVDTLFYIVLGESKNLVRLNRKPVFGTTELKDNDIVQIGETKLVFRSLCNETFDYPKDEKEGEADAK